MRQCETGVVHTANEMKVEHIYLLIASKLSKHTQKVQKANRIVFGTRFNVIFSALPAVQFTLRITWSYQNYIVTSIPSTLKARCLKITEKVSFNIASETSYIYILSGQKFIKKIPKMVQFGEFFENLKLAVRQSYQTGQFKQVKNWWKMPVTLLNNKT